MAEVLSGFESAPSAATRRALFDLSRRIDGLAAELLATQATVADLEARVLDLETP